jgi:hypothetical protein
VSTITRTKHALQVAAGAALVAGAIQPAAGQDRSLTVEVGRCVDLPTPEQRLACFEAQVEAARTAPAPAAQGGSAPATAPAATAGAQAAPAAAPVATTTTVTAPPDTFGRTRDVEDPPDIFAAVTAIRETVPNASLITLDNGQVWRQTQPEHYPLRPGQVVRIYYSRWRSYRLTNEDLRGFIHVERVR